MPLFGRKKSTNNFISSPVQNGAAGMNGNNSNSGAHSSNNSNSSSNIMNNSPNNTPQRATPTSRLPPPAPPPAVIPPPGPMPNNAAAMMRPHPQSMIPSRKELLFHCQLAHGSATMQIKDFSNVKELYQKISAAFGLTQDDVSLCVSVCVCVCIFA